MSLLLDLLVLPPHGFVYKLHAVWGLGMRSYTLPLSHDTGLISAVGGSVLLRSDQMDGSSNVSIDMESVQRNQQIQQLQQQVSLSSNPSVGHIY